jgi:hypothetical protein
MSTKWSARCSNPFCSNPSEFSYASLKAYAVVCVRCESCGTGYRWVIRRDVPPDFRKDDQSNTLIDAYARWRVKCEDLNLPL